MRYLIFSLLQILILPFAHAQGGNCANLSMYLTQPSHYMQSGSPTSAEFSVVVSANTMPGGCDYFLTFDYGSSSSFSSRSMKFSTFTWPYQLSKDASGLQVLKSFPDVSSCGDVICDSLPANSTYITKTNKYTLTIDNSNDWRRAGIYYDTVTIRLYRGTPGSYTLRDTKTMNLTYQAHKRADISVVPTGSNFNLNQTSHTLNFGSGMSTGMQRTADIILKYNAGCLLFGWSENGGKLKHSSLPDTINYTFNLNGTDISIPWWTQLATKSGASPVNGSINPVKITIGNTNGKANGIYRDTINLVVQSAE